MTNIKIMIVEDDFQLATQLKNYLIKWGYEVNNVEEFKDVLKQFNNIKPDLVLMDINLPFYDGFYWCFKIREISKVPMIFISSRDSDNDKIMAIAQGGDDFIEKSFNLTLLKAKIEAILRRTYQYKVEQKAFISEGVYYDALNSSIIKNNIEVELTKSENTIIKTLLLEKGKVVSRAILMDELWNTDEFISDNTLTVLISRLRAKLKDYLNDEIVYTKKGIGYYIK